MIATTERALGYKLPASYLTLLATQNGGIPRNRNHRSPSRTTWAEDHVALHALYGLGSEKRCSLLGTCGSRFWVEEWEYPDIGIYFADCPSAGHDMFCLDYRDCGSNGEPRVVHVDQEWDYAVTVIAPDFESFVRGLLPDDAFEV